MQEQTGLYHPSLPHVVTINEFQVLLRTLGLRLAHPISK